MSQSESRLLQEDKDAWFFQSLKRYTNLYIFDLEFPVDAIEVIDDTSICLSGIQNYSKKCEFLQMSIPPKLLPTDMEEGLCKDRDFRIISGGYAASKILQIKSVKSVKDFVVTRQEGKEGVILFKLGNDDHAVIQDKGVFSTNEENAQGISCEGQLGPMDTNSGHLVAGSSDGKFIHEWNFSTTEETFQRGNKRTVAEEGKWGQITKIKFWDDHSVAFITDKGVVCVKDLREGDEKSSTYFHASKSPFQEQESLGGTCNLLFSLDVVPAKNKIGIVDSCGGYESVDFRFAKDKRDRVVLPGCAAAPSVLVGRFNIEYEPDFGKESSNSNDIRFIVTGMNQDVVEIYKESAGNSATKDSEQPNSLTVSPVFMHDGHSKTVSHALWHPHSDKLLFSTSIDAVLHAWQFIE